MSLLDDVKILTTANSYKAGVLYSIKPDNGDGDLDITRATIATRVTHSGIIESVAVNEPQIDYTDGCGSFWLEPQSTNIVLRSAELDNVAYVKTDTTISADSIVSPDGTTNADEMTTTSATAQMYQQITVVAGTSYTYSFYAKKGTMTAMAYRITDEDNAVDLVANTNYYSSVGSDWTRITKVFTTGSGNTTIRIYALDSSTSIGTMALWGLQLEAHIGYPINLKMETSYIPTAGATVTRNRTVFDKTGLTSTIGSTEGVLFVEIAIFWDGTGTPPSGEKLLGWKSGTGTALLGMWGTNWFCWLADGGNKIFSASPTITETSFVKLAVRYKAGDHAYWKDGVVQATSTDAGAISATQDRIVSSYDGDGFWEFYGKIRTIQVYDTALTDAQLLTLTT